MSIDTSYRDRRLAQRLEDPEFRAEYERSQREIAQVDAVMRMLDGLRLQAGKSKAQLARDIDKHPASVRRLFSSEVNPELKTIAAMADALDADIVVKPRRRRRASQAARYSGVDLTQPNLAFTPGLSSACGGMGGRLLQDQGGASPR